MDLIFFSHTYSLVHCALKCSLLSCVEATISGSSTLEYCKATRLLETASVMISTSEKMAQASGMGGDKMMTDFSSVQVHIYASLHTS